MQVAPEWEPLLNGVEKVNGGYSGGGWNRSQPLQTFEIFTHQDGTETVTVEVHFPGSMFPSNAHSNNSGAELLAYKPAEAAVKEWRVILDELCNGSRHAGVEVEGDTQMAVRVPIGSLLGVLSWLSHQSGVHWLSPRPIVHTSNYQGVTILQTGRAAAIGGTSFTGIRPLWDAGLDGTGQVVGCGDSGVGESLLPVHTFCWSATPQRWTYWMANTLNGCCGVVQT
jgi:hypothetical protein